MANTITKFQANYLENRLEEIKREKIAQFKEKNTVKQVGKYSYVYTLIKTGKLKLKSAKEIEQADKHAYRCWPDVSDLFDTEKVFEDYHKEEAEIEKAAVEYQTKLSKSITAIVDSVVLQGLGIEEAITKFKAL